MSIYRNISIYYILYTMLYIGGCDHFGGCDLVLCTRAAYKLSKKFRGYGMICVFLLCLAISVAMHNCAKYVFCAIFAATRGGYPAPLSASAGTPSHHSQKQKRGIWRADHSCGNICGVVYNNIILRSNIYVILILTLRLCYRRH